MKSLINLRYLILSTLLLYCFQFNYAQEITLKDSSTNEVIINVVAFNKDHSKNTISNFDGKIDISKFNATEIIYFSHISYKDFSIQKSKIKTIIFLENDSVLKISRRS